MLLVAEHGELTGISDGIRADEEEGIVCRRPDELDRAAFHVGKEYILLGPVEAVDFVDEEQGGFAGVAKTMIGSLQNTAHFSQIGFYRVEFLEVGLRACSDDLGQGGLTGSGWPEEDERLDAVGINGAAEQETRGQKMPLACVLLQGARSHPGGQRGS